MPHPELSVVLEKERELMNFYAPLYRKLPLFNSLNYQEGRKTFVRWVLGKLAADGRDPRQLKILEVGVSSGDVLELLAHAGCANLTGLDIAENMVDETRRRVPQARVIQGSIERHDFKGEQFDAVIATFTLHHMHEAQPFFDLVNRVLAPGGRFFIGEYNADGWANNRFSRPIVEALAAPGRRLFKIKNRKVLAAQGKLPLLFNPAHRLLRWQEIRSAIPNPDAYGIERETLGLFTLAYNFALVPSSRVDHAFYRVLCWIDGIVKPFRAGGYQCITGLRKP